MGSAIWFRRDLRVGDNKAVLRALQSGEKPFCVFVVDPKVLSASSSALRTRYLKAALEELNEELDDNLTLMFGDSAVQLARFVTENGISDLYCSRDVTPLSRLIESQVAEALRTIGVRVHFVDTPYLVDFDKVLKEDGSPFRVFTPFFKTWIKSALAVEVVRLPRKYEFQSANLPEQRNWGPLGKVVSYSGHFATSSAEIVARLDHFADEILPKYSELRNFPSIDGTSRLSVALKFGRIHPRTIFKRVVDFDPGLRFTSELCWRDFFGSVLYHNPNSPKVALDPKYDAMRWDTGSIADSRLQAWKSGETGYPLVDAGMRELLETGYIHNRVRMVVGSFLVKDLHLDWRLGARHFMSHLLDGDVASNIGGWQWIAGCGSDSAPFFRIFNPTLQLQKFDPEGDYVRRFIPELTHLDKKGWASFIRADSALQDRRLYPRQIVDHNLERREARLRLSELSALGFVN